MPLRGRRGKSDEASCGLEVLRRCLGTGATFRAGQWEAIAAVALRGERALVVQRTGWGKSIVYFIATRLLRDRGRGLTLIVSPLLALMRDQERMARRLGIRAATLNSTNAGQAQPPPVQQPFPEDPAFVGARPNASPRSTESAGGDAPDAASDSAGQLLLL